MRAVIQRVSSASVNIEKNIIAEIDAGLLIFLGIEDIDDQKDSSWLANKIANLRIFTDDSGKMNKSLIDIQAEVIVVSQFTLHAKTKKGNRPSYIRAARTEDSLPLYHNFIKDMSAAIDKEVKSGEFGANMQVLLMNDGPVTIIIDTKNKE